MKHLLLWSFLLPALLLAGCSKDDTGSGGNDSDAQVQFKAGMAAAQQTRVSDDAGAIWDGGEQVGIYMVKAGNIMTANAPYTASAGETASLSPADTPIYYPADGSDVQFSSYYPYSGALTDNTLNFSVADQSNQSAIDIMYAAPGKTYNKTSGTVELNYKHRLAKLNFTLLPGDDLTAADLAGAKITIAHQLTQAMIHLPDCMLSLTSATFSSIDALMGADGTTGEAIVLPGVGNQDADFVITTAAGRIYTVPLKDIAYMWSAGYKYGYNITLGKTAATMTATITPWNDGGTTQIVGTEKPLSPDFTDVTADYFYDWYDCGAGNYVFYLYYGDGQDLLCLDFLSTYFADMMEARLIPDGTYAYKPDTQAPFTMTGKNSYLGRINPNNSQQINVASYVNGGQFTLTRGEGNNYTIDFDLTFDNGEHLQTTWQGTLLLAAFHDAGQDYDLQLQEQDFDRIAAFPEDSEGMWQISFDGSSHGELLQLYFNEDPGRTQLMAGNYTMADKAKQYEFLTAEPTSLFQNTGTELAFETGTYYSNNGVTQDAIPGTGYINITKLDGFSQFAVEFSFEGPDGHTVSGNYSGYIEGGEFNTGGGDEGLAGVKFSSAEASYYGNYPNSTSFDLELYGDNGEYFYAETYCALYTDPMLAELTGGLYTFDETYSSDPMTFPFSCVTYMDGDDSIEVDATDGTFDVTHNADGGVTIVFDYAMDSGETWQYTYTGPLTYNDMPTASALHPALHAGARGPRNHSTADKHIQRPVQHLAQKLIPVR